MKNNRFVLVTLALTGLVASSLQAAEEQAHIKLCQMDERNTVAIEYVGTRSTGGRVQLRLLELEGLQSEDYVLEIGCGALMASIPIMSFLEKSHFVGMDPNPWLRESSLTIPENWEVVEAKRPLFLNNTDFDAQSVGIVFDYAFAHSIMSHASDEQLSLFLENVSRVLKENGKLIFSLRLTEPSEYGNEGAQRETHAKEWQYPGCSFFAEETLVREATKWFSKVERKKEFTRLLTEDSKGVCHDWFVMTK